MAYLHLLSNHVPILGSLFGVLLLVVALVKPNLHTTLSAYLILLVSGIGGIVAYFTGEPAEESIEHVAGISHKLIHVHEEMAEKLAIVLYLLGIVSIVGLYTNFKKNTKANLVSYLTVVIAAIGVFLGQKTGTTGGEIRHTEIRNNSNPS